MAQEYSTSTQQEKLVDLRDVKLDSSMSQTERIQSYLKQIKNPYCFRVGDVVVNVAYTKGGATLNGLLCRYALDSLNILEKFLSWTS